MKKTFLATVLLLFVFFLVFLSKDYSSYDKKDAVICLITVLLGVIITVIGQQNSVFKGFWTRPSNVLVLGLLIVNYQFVLDMVLGIKTLNYFVRPGVVYQTCYYSTFGVLACLSGINFPRSDKQQWVPVNNITSRTISITFLVIIQAVFFFIWAFTTDIRSLVAGLLYGVRRLNYWEDLFYDATLAIMVCIVMNSMNKGVRSLKDFLAQNSVFSWVLICSFIFIKLVSGDRGPAVYLFLAIFYVYIFVSKHKVGLVRLVIFLFLGGVAISVLGIARVDAQSGSFRERATSAFTKFKKSGRYENDNTILDITSELARSHRCNLYAVDLVQNKGESYHKGKYQMYQVLRLIPFVPGYLENKLHISPAELNSDMALTMTEKGDFYKWGQIGTTCIADFYLDLGLVGVIIGMFLLGLLFGWIDKSMLLEKCIKPFPLIIIIVFSSMSIYISRSCVISQMKPVLYVAILYYFNAFLHPKS